MASQYHLKSLHGIRDNALLLSLGHKYLCHESLLKKFGEAIDSHLSGLKDEIAAIKKKFPGKFLFQQRVDTDRVIEDLRWVVDKLKNPDKDITKKCSAGEVGQKLEASVQLLYRGIEEIKDQVEGRGVRYTAIDALSKQIRRIGVIFKALGYTTKVVIKIAIILAVITLIPLVFLFVTMESEARLSGDVAELQAFISTQKRIVAEYDGEIANLSKKVEAMREAAPDPNRQELVEIMDLNVKIHTLNEKREKAQIAINIHEKDIMEMTVKLEKLKKKTFVERLLRR